MSFKILKDDRELELFRDYAERYISVRFPLDYLQKSKVVAYYSEEGRMCGGYAFVLKPPFRVIESLPEFVRKRSEALRKVSMESLFEFTGLWLSPEIRCRRIASRFWFQIYRDILTLGKSHFVYAYSLDKPALGKLYSICRPDVIFQGETKILAGMKRAENESVEMSSLARVAVAPLLRPQLLTRRLLGGERHLEKKIRIYDPAIREAEL